MYLLPHTRTDNPLVSLFAPLISPDRKCGSMVSTAMSPTRSTDSDRDNPELHDQRSNQELLHQAHLSMRQHFQSTKLNQPQSTRTAVRRVGFVDTELGPVRVSSDIHQQVSERIRSISHGGEAFAGDLVEHRSAVHKSHRVDLRPHAATGWSGPR